jgi:uncharacterized protein (TIRG00374 family)
MKLTRLFQLIGLAIFLIVIANTGILRIASIFAGVSVPYLLLGIVLTLVVMLLKGLKWKYVIRLHGVDYPLIKSTKVWAIGLFAGMITPGRAGDIVRSLYLNRDRGGLGRSVSTVIVDRAIDLLVILIFAVFGVLFFTQLFLSGTYVAILSVIFVCFVAAIYIATRKELMRKLLGPIFERAAPKKYKQSIRSSFHEFYSSITCVLSKKPGLLSVFFLTVFIWIFSIYSVQVMALAVGVEIDYFFLLSVMSLTVIVELIPISISGIGTREAFLIFSLGLIGITAESAVAFSILYLLTYCVNGSAGLVFWLRDPIKIDV